MPPLNEILNRPEPLAEQVEQKEVTATPAVARKPFVEPTVSVPVDVLQATAFFQAADTTIDTSDV
ncbi:MAG TPA: hypothetical protein VER08_05765 [Pyrinomonadaceae bacterium]|nr:hypothetical protein [Pyrinomonadaceae bacterium]